MIIKFLIFCIFFPIVSSTIIKREHNRLQAHRAVLDCTGKNDVLFIKYAKYYYESNLTDVTERVMDMCKEKVKCSFIPRDKSFIDPAPGIVQKRFYAEYFCISKYKFNFILFLFCCLIFSFFHLFLKKKIKKQNLFQLTKEILLIFLVEMI